MAESSSVQVPFTAGIGNEDPARDSKQLSKDAAERAQNNIAALTQLLNTLKQQLSEALAAEKSIGGKASQQNAQLSDIQNDQKDLKAEFARQAAIGLNTRVNGWQKFPTGTITLRIGEAILEGHFEYNKFITTNVIYPKYVTKIKRNFADDPRKEKIVSQTKVTFINPGAQVQLISDFPIYYVVNILPSVVHSVYAMRAVEGGGENVMTLVSPNYYYVEQKVFGPYNCTFLVFPRALSTYDEGWEDEIFVTHTSTVGPNIVHIITWLITKYTTLAYDHTNFSAITAKVRGFPAHFMLYDKKNVIALLEDICFQARLAIWLDDDVFKLRYLPAEEPAVDTITQNDIEFGSMEITFSRTEDLITKLVATWKYFYRDQDPNLIILRYNINKYGLHEQTYDFFIYNMFELVKLAATYWIIHRGNTFKLIRFRTPLHKLRLETFDVVNLSGLLVANTTVKGIIQSANYSIGENYIDFEVWVPVRIGEMVRYRFAYPDGLTEFDYFPPKEEILRGAVGNPAGSDGIKNNTAGGSLPGAASSIVPKAADDKREEFTNTPQDVGSVHPTTNATGGYSSTSGQPAEQIDPYTMRTRSVEDGASDGIGDYKVGEKITVGGNVHEVTNVTVDSEGHKIYTLGEPLSSATGPDSVILPSDSLMSEDPVQKSLDLDWFRYPEPEIKDDPVFTSVVPSPMGGGDGDEGGGVPIKILNGSGDSYAAAVYPDGPDEESTVIEVKILQIDPESQIPEGTWMIATKIDGRYYSVIPLWL